MNGLGEMIFPLDLRPLWKNRMEHFQLSIHQRVEKERDTNSNYGKPLNGL